MKRKLLGFVIPVLVVIEFCSIFLMVKSFNNKDSEVTEEINEQVVRKKQFAMFVENDSGVYEEYDSELFPTGYVLNSDRTVCTDNNGREISNEVLSINNNYITVQSGKTVYCYLYFDKS